MRGQRVDTPYLLQDLSGGMENGLNQYSGSLF